MSPGEDKQDLEEPIFVPQTPASPITASIGRFRAACGLPGRFSLLSGHDLSGRLLVSAIGGGLDAGE